ncbi:unnamed protein product [Cyclocybe aegerita]|uniref:UBX domain-containing protein n=1 Tax=Cyclocybe aegerita TaxID=1973307 RepID=A0A8S0Y0F7_CYCAE|nr:unnamed protein product [Cyclocybe aegerita]
MDDLDNDQRAALQQLREITNGADDDVAIGVLSSVDWDVQRAAELIFGTSSGAPNPPASSGTRRIEVFEVDDSGQGDLEEPVRPRRNSNSTALAVMRPFLSLFAVPLHFLSNIIRFIFGLLRIPVPQFRFTGLNFYRPLRPRLRPQSRGGPDRWLRELEEETGAISIGRSKLPRGTTSSISVGGQSSSSVSSRAAQVGSGNGIVEDGRKYLPDFVICGYEEMLRTCQREAKIGCVILVSDEHDDTPEFKRSTLTDPAFVKILYDNDVVVWGGDVQDREAWTAAEKLQATTYPFVAFVALQPPRAPASSRSSSSPPSLTVLSRHQGPPTPHTSGPTSAPTLVTHLETQLLPRVTPFLARISAAQRERERDRQLRDEQDRAFRNAARRDKERIEAKMAEERRMLEARRLAEEEARLAAARRAREAELARARESNRMEWRRWTRKAVVGAEVEGSLRIAIRLPSGGRVIRSFQPTASLTALFAFVDSQFVPANLSPYDDPATLPDQQGVGETALERHVETHGPQEEYWGFKIVIAYPRVEIPWSRGKTLVEIEHLRGGGQVVVELVSGGRRSTEAHAEEDDGYHTEDSE